MNKFLQYLSYVPVVLKRLAHLITHLFCDIDYCKDGDDNA